MNAYDELAGFRFTPGRDYDKRSVEMFRARAMNIVDDLLDQVTTLRDEVAALRAAGHEAPPAVAAARIEPASSWLTVPSAGSFPPPFTATSAGAASTGTASPRATAPGTDPAVASWVSAIENPANADDDRHNGHHDWSDAPSSVSSDWDAWAPASTSVIDDEPDAADKTAPAPAPATSSPLLAPIDLGVPAASSSTARLLLGGAAANDAAANDADAIDAAGTIDAADADDRADADETAEWATMPTDDSDRELVIAAVAATSDQPISPIVIDASPDEIGALPTPVRHWSGWLKR